MPSLSIFANFYINDVERFIRLKDSFKSIEDMDADRWVINIRGKYKFDVLFFLHERLGEKLIPFILENKKGWFNDTKKMLDSINTDYVFFWLEDHVNLIDASKYAHIITEMHESKSEYLCYSWWSFGKPKKLYEAIKKENFDNIESFILDERVDNIVEILQQTYIISMAGIFANSLFKEIIEKGPPLLRTYPKQTPFNFEKGGEEKSWLPLKMSIPKYELFASIDDDFGLPGVYSLQSRGLYPVRQKRALVVERKINVLNRAWRVIKKYLPEWVISFIIKTLNFFGRLRRFIYLVLHNQ